MNNLLVLMSKLIMPDLSPSFLMTDRIKMLHENMKVCRGISVCAPAGYGKTSLAVSFLNCQAAAPHRVCWYRLDTEDKNISVFIAHLAEAIFPSHEKEFAESRKALQAAIGTVETARTKAAGEMHEPQDRKDTKFPSQRVISTICREMWAHYSPGDTTRTYIVLDDFHEVAQVPDICDLTSYMLNNLPPSCTMILLSRACQNIFTEKQKLENRILEIGPEDLAFNNVEIQSLLVSMGQNATNKNLTDFIAETTEGWIAGIILLCQAIRNRGVDADSIVLDNMGHEDALFRYMSLEILEFAEDSTQDALTKLALLQEFSQVEASSILGINNVNSLMKQCIGFGMFIQSIPGDPIVYRFHSLFREFLLSVLKERYSEEYIAGLHLKAAGHYMEQAAYGRAAEHLTVCGNSALAMDMVSQAGFNKFMIGETGQLKMWLDLLPEDIIGDNPVLLLFKAQLMPNSRQPEMVDTLKKVMHLSLQNNDLATYFDVASVLIYIFMCSNNMKGLLEMTEGFPQRRQNVSLELDNTLGIIDLVMSIAEENYEQAKVHSESTLYALLPEDSQWLYLILSCITYCCLGSLDLAQRCMENALILDKFKHIEPSRGFILLFLSITLCLKNEKEMLPSYISEIAAIGDKYDYEYLSAHGNRLAAFNQYLSFDGEAAVKSLGNAVFFFHHINNTAMAAACRLLRCLWTIKPDSSFVDIDAALKDLALIQEANPGMVVYETSLSILGAIAREAGNFPLAEEYLLQSIEAAQAKKEYQVLCGSCFHLARLYFAWGHEEQGHRYLKDAMELAAGNKYYMFWDIHIPTLVETALRCIKYEYCSDYAEELLGTFYDARTVIYLRERMKTLEEDRTTAFVEDFISTYRGELASQLYFVKASLFGNPEISVNGIKIPDAEWKTKKVKGFLEYLLLNRGNAVSKETLAEIFWPSADGKSAIASQRTALYHLRKTLAKYNVEVTGPHAFIHETGVRLEIRRNDALALDLDKFLQLKNELALFTDGTAQTQDKQRDILERMTSLYHGDLMEGSDYGDQVIEARESFKSVFIEACQKLAAIYIKAGELKHAEEILRRALTAEPYSENICLKLLKLYMSQGRKSKAAKLYYSFKKRLEQDLEIKVDKILTETIRNPK